MISLIMGVYNNAKTLRCSLDSIIHQTYESWEFIICDDCSSDASGQILDEYAQADSRIKVFHHSKNLGLAASLNDCLQMASGKFIARMDADDLSVKNRLEVQLTFLESHPEYDLVGTYMQAFDDSGPLYIIKNKSDPTKWDLPKGSPFAHATVMMRAEVMRKLNGYCVSSHTVRTEDVDLWYRFFAAGFRGTTIPEPLYHVRVDSSALKRRKLKYMLHASYIIWYGTSLVHLPFYYKVFCLKPILSWLLPSGLKVAIRQRSIHKSDSSQATH